MSKNFQPRTVLASSIHDKRSSTKHNYYKRRYGWVQVAEVHLCSTVTLPTNSEWQNHFRLACSSRWQSRLHRSALDKGELDLWQQQKVDVFQPRPESSRIETTTTPLQKPEHTTYFFNDEVSTVLTLAIYKRVEGELPVNIAALRISEWQGFFSMQATSYPPHSATTWVPIWQRARTWHLYLTL